MSVKCVIFARVSSKTERQDYERQVSDLKRVAAKKEWKVVKVVAAKISASRTPYAKRQDLMNLLKESENVDKVLVTEISRISRRPADALYYIELLRQNNTSVYIQSLNVETNAETARDQMITNIILTIMAEFAGNEAREMSERIKSGMEAAARKGRLPGRPKGSTESLAEKIRTNTRYAKAAKLITQGKQSIRDMATLCGLSKGTIQKIKKHLEATAKAGAV